MLHFSFVKGKREMEKLRKTGENWGKLGKREHM